MFGGDVTNVAPGEPRKAVSEADAVLSDVGAMDCEYAYRLAAILHSDRFENEIDEARAIAGAFSAKPKPAAWSRLTELNVTMRSLATPGIAAISVRRSGLN